MREYVTLVNTRPTSAHDDSEIVLMIYGPRGGIRSCEGMPPSDARKLRDALDRALLQFNKEDQR